jgi:hypothetical protein
MRRRFAATGRRMRLRGRLPSSQRDRAPFALIVAITACGTLGMHLIVPALPATARALRVSPATIQLIMRARRFDGRPDQCTP